MTGRAVRLPTLSPLISRWEIDRMQLPQWRKLLLTIHVVATVGVLGADLVLLALGISGVRGAEPQTVYPAAHLVAAWLVAPLAVVALGTGLLLGVLTPWGLLKYWWVTIKLTITVVLAGLVFLVLVPRLGATADAATGSTSQLPTASERRLLAVAPAVTSALLTLNVALAVYKPRRRLRFRHTEKHSNVTT